MNNYSATLTYLEKMPNAIAGSGGDKSTRRAAMVCRRFNLSDSEMWNAMLWFNANKCQPAWSEKELRHKMSGLAGVAVTRPLGQRQIGQAHRRAFVAPTPPPAPEPDLRPVIERSEQEEETWWARWAVDHGTTLEAFDEAVGNA